MTQKPTIGVVGLGAMGLGLAQLFAQNGYQVIATDNAAAMRETAKNRLCDVLNPRVQSGKMGVAECEAILGRIQIADGLSGLGPAVLVIEAIIEKLAAKQALFAALEDVVGKDCVLATNTSSLSVAAIMQGLKQPSRGLGLHFFNPVPLMKLVELVATSETSSSAAALARELVEGAGKTVIACADTPGFIVNRCARPFYGEALALLEEGRSASDIDAAMLQAGYKLGPFSLIDLVGADVNLAATESLHAAMGNNPRYHVFEALRQQVAAGKLGRKSGQGFLFPQSPGTPPPDSNEIALRIEAALANEAASLLDQDVMTPEAIDTAMKLGLNFPRGPFESARLHGTSLVRGILLKLETQAPAHLKGRYAAMPALEKMA